jgi:NAD(P)-dependent dehydrogenase (short-subunit alcohol dehydrogenase family)
MKVASGWILVSGGSSGLGAACVDRFLELGCSVLNFDIAPPRTDVLTRFPNRCQYVSGDVTKEEDVRSAIALGTKRFKKQLSAAITCAGILHSERAVGRDGAGSLDSFRRVVEINLIGTYNVARLSAESMSQVEVPVADADADAERGVIVMTASIAAFDGQTGQSAYAASKGGVAAMALPLARDFGRLGIRVVCIAPGVFETPMMQVAPEKVRSGLLAETPFPHRFGEPREFALTVQHVIENAMFNGCTLRLDAGLRMPAK